MVVDPNTDTIVSANRIAESIGIRRGTRFIDRVSADPRARAHYERTQVATSEPRRAYGVPIRVETNDGQSAERFALVRSVAVTAPIEALEADERHRLGILFLVEPAFRSRADCRRRRLGCPARRAPSPGGTAVTRPRHARAGAAAEHGRHNRRSAARARRLAGRIPRTPHSRNRLAARSLGSRTAHARFGCRRRAGS